MTAPELTLDELPPLDAIEAELESRDLSRFTKAAWPVVDPDDYLHNWHIDAISEHLAAVNRGEVKRLLINIPPRHMKSMGAAVTWPAWTWQLPKRGYITKGEPAWTQAGAGVRFLFSSYAQALSIRDSVKCRRLIESDWYRSRFPGRFNITSDQNAKGRYDNDRGGYRLATSVTGSLTGEGGDIVVIDDPHNASEALSEIKRTGVITWWRESMSTRLNSVRVGAFVIIMQRLHESDLSGHILAADNAEDWTHLCLPGRYDAKHPHRWKGDPRKTEGQLLWPERFPEKEMRALEIELGTYGAAGQIQQRPSPRKGGMYEYDWFEVVDAAPATVRWIRVWDLAATKKNPTKANDPDYTCCMKFGKDPLTGLMYVGWVTRRQMGPLDVEKSIVNTASQDGKHVAIAIPQDPAQAGKAQFQHLVRKLMGYNVRRFLEVQEGNKVQRALAPSAQAEAGNIKLVKGPWNAPFLAEICLFPNSTHKDQADCLSEGFHMIDKPLMVTANVVALPVGTPYSV